MSAGWRLDEDEFLWGESNETRQRCVIRERAARIWMAVRRSSCFRGHSQPYYHRHGAAGMSRHPAPRKHDRRGGAGLQWQDNLLLPIARAAAELGDQDVLHAGDGDHLSVHQQYPRGRDGAGRRLESRSRAIGVQASDASDAARSDLTFCTQGMEITYQCTNNTRAVVTVPGDAWSHGPAQLACKPPTLPTPPGPAPPVTPQIPNVISVTTARQGCLDIQPAGNMTGLVGRACNGRTTCS